MSKLESFELAIFGAGSFFLGWSIFYVVSISGIQISQTAHFVIPAMFAIACIPILGLISVFKKKASCDKGNLERET